MAYLELNNVTYIYPNKFMAIEDVSMSFEKGESVAIIGQNGAGKTTTVKLMNGLLKPTSGDIFIDGENTKKYSTAKISKKVGYVFQNPDDQIFHSDVYSEIEFAPKHQGLSKEEIRKKTINAATICGLEGFLNEHPYSLPYSMRKFVTIASIIAMDPEVIILDEPTAGQDANSMKVISKIIKHLVEKNKTVITITHDMEFVVNNFNRVIVMANKKKQADGDKRSIFWNREVLQISNLKQPYIAKLASEANINCDVLSIGELIESLS